MEAVIAAFIITCSNIYSAPSFSKDIQKCVQRVTECSKKKINSTTYGDSVLDCAKEVY